MLGGLRFFCPVVELTSRNYKVVPQFVSVQLVNATPITIWFIVDISIVNGDYKPTYNWGAPPCKWGTRTFSAMGLDVDATQRQVRAHIYKDPNADPHRHGDEAAGAGNGRPMAMRTVICMVVCMAIKMGLLYIL